MLQLRVNVDDPVALRKLVPALPPAARRALRRSLGDFELLGDAAALRREVLRLCREDRLARLSRRRLAQHAVSGLSDLSSREELLAALDRAERVSPGVGRGVDRGAPLGELRDAVLSLGWK